MGKAENCHSLQIKTAEPDDGSVVCLYTSAAFFNVIAMVPIFCYQ
jgi:hypothetical protein